jgi:alanyl-tRNA synthetase
MSLTGNQIRQSFLDFFARHGHRVVPSASLVPGGDSTLLFTNAGMVQFKDVFLGTANSPSPRVANSQKCMRVSGKHNDLDTVGRDDTHHTFFEMLGNWSFGDYYKKEAIAWSWELLVNEWGLDPSKLYASYFVDEEGVIPDDIEARDNWLAQPGFNPEHLVKGNRHDNFWEMAETGPCGPCTEIHYDFGPNACNKQGVPGHICQVNGDCNRIVEIWNNVFIQFNRLSPTEFQPLPKTHVDTGMGLERIISVLQGVKGNYETDLLKPLLDETQRIAGQSDQQRAENLTAYRVIADHTRAASFLIADGVIPGNVGRNYVCRMIIRRAARFARTIGLKEPFMAQVAHVVVDIYGQHYPELKREQELIYESFTREESRFAETLDAGFAELDLHMQALKDAGKTVLGGYEAFDLYATLGFPLEITRDILSESGFSVDEDGFYAAMEEHRLASGKGQAGVENNSQKAELYQALDKQLHVDGILGSVGVIHDPYTSMSQASQLLAIIKDGQIVERASEGDEVELVIQNTPFYLESGGQVSDTGNIISSNAEKWEVAIANVIKPSAGLIVHLGKVLHGTVKTKDRVVASVDVSRRRAIMRNHTGTHLLHTALRKVLGEKVHQAGSAVDADRLRFDFNYPQAVAKADLLKIEALVNSYIADEYPVIKQSKTLEQAQKDGAMALFGEKYGAEVRTIEIKDERGRVSYELCGGTHVDNTAEIGSFYITSESSVAAGIRRIEAVTGLGAYEYARKRLDLQNELSAHLQTSPSEALGKVQNLEDSLKANQLELEQLRLSVAKNAFASQMDNLQMIMDVPVLTATIPNVSSDALRELADEFRQKHSSGVVVLATTINDKPSFIAALTPDLVKRGLKAGDLIKRVAAVVGGGGGGRPDMAQAGGKDPSKIVEALDQVAPYIKENLK